ncbi:MAG: lipase family alpha/beta hydrolase [Nocardioidaceae bacterium]
MTTNCARDVRSRRPRSDRAGLLGALALATEVTDEVILGTVREVHGAWARRAFGATGPVSRLPRTVHDGVSGAVYGGLGAGLRGTAELLRAADRRGVGARLEATPHGRVAVAAVNGLIGDRLAREHPELAISLAVRKRGEDVPVDPVRLAAAFPDATPDVVVFLHGLGEDDSAWSLHADRNGGRYGDRLSADGWTPVYLRANTGLPVAENGAALAGLLDDLVAGWPSDVRRLALVGHSMGGLVMRAACAVTTAAERRWTDLVTDVVTLGTPHLGAPLERGVRLGARTLGLLPESAPFGRILDFRSTGILDLRLGLARDVQNLPHARYRLVAATLAASHRHPVSEALGDLLVRYPSAVGRPRRGEAMFPDAEVLHVRGDHFDLLNHPDVHEALRRWLG